MAIFGRVRSWWGALTWARQRALWSAVGMVIAIVVSFVAHDIRFLAGWCLHRIWMWEWDEPQLERKQD